jgi:hypothetical protein
MHGSGTEQSTVEDALKTLAYKADVNYRALLNR